MMKKKRVPVCDFNSYMTLFSDGKIGMNDGSGYLGTLDYDETRKLYEALKSFYDE